MGTPVCSSSVSELSSSSHSSPGDGRGTGGGGAQSAVACCGDSQIPSPCTFAQCAGSADVCPARSIFEHDHLQNRTAVPLSPLRSLLAGMGWVLEAVKGASACFSDRDQRSFPVPDMRESWATDGEPVRFTYRECPPRPDRPPYRVPCLHLTPPAWRRDRDALDGGPPRDGALAAA